MKFNKNIDYKWFKESIGFTNFLTYEEIVFNPIQMRLFRRAHSWGTKKLSSLKSVTYILQWWNWHTYTLPIEDPKKYINHVRHLLSSANISNFLLEISKFCYIKKYRCRLYFDTLFISYKFFSLERFF